MNDSWAAHFNTPDTVLSLRSRRFELADIELATASTADAGTIEW